MRGVGGSVRGVGGSAPPSFNMLTSIQMLDPTHGWALIQNSILHTVDGGFHWQNVTPANANIDLPLLKSSVDFLDDQDAWVAPPHLLQKSISILRTTDGGNSWQNSTIQTTVPEAGPAPHFLNASEGWLAVHGLPTGILRIFHTTDGGQNWNQLASPNMKDIPYSSGISFSDTQNGWETGTGSITVQPALEVTHDGGQTWQSQSLAVPPEMGKFNAIATIPPVFFGNNGLLPVEAYNSSLRLTGLGLYVTHDSGQTWTPTTLLTNNISVTINTIDVVDSQHVWAELGSYPYTTSDGGQSWTQMSPIPQPIALLSFIDANNGWSMSVPRVTLGNTRPNLLRTTDGGQTWQLINSSAGK